MIVNIEYPLGLAAYNILREVTTSTDVVKGVYVLGKAATLNADVGDVLISGVIHDEHRARPTGSTTRSRSTTSRRSCASAPGSTTSAP